MSIEYVERHTALGRSITSRREKWGYCDPVRGDNGEFIVNLTRGTGVDDDSLDCSCLWFKGDAAVAETWLEQQYERAIAIFLGKPGSNGRPYSRHVGDVNYLRSNNRTYLIGYLIQFVLLSESNRVILLHDKRDSAVTEVIIRYLHRIEEDIRF